MERFEGQNWGLLKSIKIVAYDKATFNKNQNEVNFDEILIENGYEFVEIPFILESANFHEEEKRVRAGSYFEKKVALTIPKLRSEVSGLLDGFRNRKIIALVTDYNDISHLVYPLRMTENRHIPGTATSLNASTVELSGEGKRRSPVVINVPADQSPSV